MAIKRLDENTVKKIAAGEVIERPVSVVKELVENSIDAGADQVSVEISRGGLDQILVTDNGSGINSNEISLAFERHATSKIEEFDDLYKTTSLGFRGEALASILVVADVEIRTKTEEEDLGCRVIFNNGKEIDRQDIAMTRGTSIRVSNIFQDLPARKKFLKSDRVEANKITSCMYEQALSHPEVSMTYRKDGKTVFNLSSGLTLKNKLLSLFGKDLNDHLLDLDIIRSSVSLKGFLSDNLYYRGNRGQEYIFINGRYIVDDDIRDTVEDAYNSIIPNGRFPAFFLYFTMEPDELDVNIHPNKQRVKISNFDDFLPYLKDAVKERITSKQKINSIDGRKEEVPPSLDQLKRSTDYEDVLEAYNPIKSPLEEESPYAQLIKEEGVLEKDEPLSFIRDTSLEDQIPDLFGEEKTIEENQVPKEGEKKKSISWSDLNWELIGIIFDTYILFQEGYKSCYIIDQHAAHERINYEKYMDQWKRSQIPVQVLLAPIILDLNPKEREVYQDNQAHFENLGFDISSFTDKAIAIRAIPQILEKADISNLISNILDKDNFQEGFDKDIEEKIIMSACKHSVKAGDKLNREEVDSLMTDLLNTDQPYTCPHGRPILLRLNKYELEKLFMRVK